MTGQSPSRKKVRITVVKRLAPSAIFEKVPAETVKPFSVCGRFTDNQEFIVAEDGSIPSPDFCLAAWQALWEPIRTLAFGGDYPWFKEKGVSVNCCTDGLRPVVFKLERIEK